MTYTKISIIAGLSATLFAGVAMAAANFHYANGALVTSGPEAGNYTASCKETGLANTPITYDLEATTSYTFQCFTKSGNKPQGSPNSGGPSSQNTQTTITPHNGQITGSLSLDVVFPPTDVACKGGGLKLCLTAVSYTGVSLMDANNSITANLPDASTSGIEVCSE
jgi:hypothetical protein